MPAGGGLRSLGLVALLGALAGRALGQGPSGAADVAVTVRAGYARVDERIVLAPAPASFELRALTRPCADIGDVRVEGSGTAVDVAPRPDGPWLVLGDTTPLERGDTLRLRVRYVVGLSGPRADIPLWHPTTPIPQRDGEREGTVSVRVSFEDASGRAVFPHMARRSPLEWGARYVALPSFVEVTDAGIGGGAPTPCASPGGPRGDDGGLGWRFLTLVGVMVAWVPLYLAWARRSGEEDG
jgi:hypothetical protein